MIPCISQATTMASPFEADLESYSRGGWTAVELWLTKLETFLESNPFEDARSRLTDSGLTPVAAAAQGGLLSDEAATPVHAELFRRRLDLLAALGVPTLIIVPDFTGDPSGAALGLAIDGLGRAAERAAAAGVRLALEPQKTARLGASLDTAAAIVGQVGAANLGICLDVFHYYTGPSKFEDLAYLSPDNLFHVQLSDVGGTPRELAGDRDRVLPGDGDFGLVPWLEQIGKQGYGGAVSLEVLNPSLWSIPADRVADFGFQAMERVLRAARGGR